MTRAQQIDTAVETVLHEMWSDAARSASAAARAAAKKGGDSRKAARDAYRKKGGIVGASPKLLKQQSRAIKRAGLARSLRSKNVGSSQKTADRLSNRVAAKNRRGDSSYLAGSKGQLTPFASNKPFSYAGR